MVVVIIMNFAPTKFAMEKIGKIANRVAIVIQTANSAGLKLTLLKTANLLEMVAPQIFALIMK
jgi:Mg2+/citrate symporter